MLITLIRLLFVLLGFVGQILLWMGIYSLLMEYVTIVAVIYYVAGVLLMLWMIKNSKNYSYTLPWILILVLFPVFGAPLYYILERNRQKSKRLKNILAREAEYKKYLHQDPLVRAEFQKNSSMRYITDYAGFPATRNNQVDYYPLGEKALPVMLEELKKAEHFIFFEYFIVSHGKMWHSILDILEEKAAQGVDVRVMYDDLGCLMTLGKNYPKQLEQKGIKCVVFNQLNPLAGIIMNNRDHRKILVIDGKTAFSGGINIADEYINIGSKYGHWKDNGIRIKGDAVWNYTVLFLSLWNAFRKDDEDFTRFRVPEAEALSILPGSSKNLSVSSNGSKPGTINPRRAGDSGYVIPYGLSPLRDDLIGENIYLNIINQAHDYVYIFTPYLIIDTDMINSLILAARRGVDVRLVIPGIPDKKIVYTLSESYVDPLVQGGVKIYKYTPGFVHAKVFVSDDHVATVGTINLDYRSLYLHFECGCYLEGCDVISDIKKDLEDTIEICRQVAPAKAALIPIKGIWQAFLRLVAPLM